MKNKKKSIAIFLIIMLGLIVIVAVSTDIFDRITGNVIAEKGVVAYYTFENDVKDSTGNGFDSRDVPYMFKYSEGRIGRCLDFNKGGGYVLIEDNEGLHLPEFSLSFWSKLNDPSQMFQGGIGKGNFFSLPQSFSYVMQFSANKLSAAISNTQNQGFELETPIKDTKWHFWLMAAGDGKLKLYKDGVVQGVKDYEGEIDYIKEKNDIFIGTSLNDKFLFDGKIDELKIWNYALTEEEVAKEYESYPSLDYCGDDVCDSKIENATNCKEDCFNCFDSDKGLVYGVKGTCTDSDGSNIVDACGGDDWIKEAYCNDFTIAAKCKTESHRCAFGCSDGICAGE